MSYIYERCRWPFEELRCAYCSKCGRPSGVIECCGCRQVFCSDDNKDHRRELRQRLSKLKQQYYGWYENWMSDKTNQTKMLRKDQANLLDEIKSWERNSIAEISRAADEARQKVQEPLKVHMRMPEDFVAQSLIQRIEQAEKVDDFHDFHLKRWTDELDDLQRRLKRWIPCCYRIEYTGPFIEKLIVREINVPSSIHEFPSFDDIDGRSVVVKRPGIGGILPDNLPEFHSGIHRFYFKARQYSFGIVSKYGIVGRQAGTFPIQYGWTADNRVYIDGIPMWSHAGYQSDMELGDNFMLEVDCERRFLYLRNQRTGQTYELNVDVQRCPLPWQLVFQSFSNTNRHGLQYV